jgi:hypothetical protein
VYENAERDSFLLNLTKQFIIVNTAIITLAFYTRARYADITCLQDYISSG